MGNNLEILLKNCTPAEERMRTVLFSLLAKYDLTGWIFTNAIEVDEMARPHSHPVLTLNTEYKQDEIMALSEFVHEQLHWFEEEHADSRDRAIDETALFYPNVPSMRPEGVGDETSTRLHLLVCYLEFQAMECFVGNRMARETMTALSQHHYCWVYRTILSDELTIGDIIRKYDLLPEPLRHRDVRRAPNS
jgi:hypothetical protein